MELLAGLLPWIQIILSVILVVTIILQQSAAGVGGAFGGGDGSAINRTRRGAERTLFRATIVLVVLFACSALLSFFVTPTTTPQTSDIQVATSTATSVPASATSTTSTK